VLTTFDKNDPLLQERQYAYVGGTSFATPQVAGAAALVKDKRGDLDAPQIAARLQNRATDLGEPSRDDEYGHGLLNAKCTVSPAKDGC
jgi:subtilisin family serine protease